MSKVLTIKGPAPAICAATVLANPSWVLDRFWDAFQKEAVAMLDFKILRRKAHSALIRAHILPPRTESVGWHMDMRTGNTCDIGAETDLQGTLVVNSGTGNKVSIGARTQYQGKMEFEGSNNCILIGSDCRFRGKILIKGDNQTVRIGAHTTVGSGYLLCQESCDIEIGPWCMFSRDLELRTTDAHSLIDRETGNRTNPGESVKIGTHVWVGVGVLISKGAQIPDDCVVSARSFVTRKFTESGTVIAGTPAKIVRTGITWNRGRRKSFKPEQLSYWHDPASPE